MPAHSGTRRVDPVSYPGSVVDLGNSVTRESAIVSPIPCPIALLGRDNQQYDGQPLKGTRGRPGPARDLPVHPALAAMLAEWKLGGFTDWVERKPRADDHLVPDHGGGVLSLRKIAYWMEKDAERLRLPLRQATHISRRTFITLAVAAGASPAWVDRITHNSSGDVLAGYTVNDWDAMCDVVKRLRVERKAEGEVVALRGAGQAAE